MKALKDHGICDIHRLTYEPVKIMVSKIEQLSLDDLEGKPIEEM